ncbi:unnamed protein product, partial [Polarella glacialis]
KQMRSSPFRTGAMAMPPQVIIDLEPVLSSRGCRIETRLAMRLEDDWDGVEFLEFTVPLSQMQELGSASTSSGSAAATPRESRAQSVGATSQDIAQAAALCAVAARGAQAVTAAPEYPDSPRRRMVRRHSFNFRPTPRGGELLVA